MAEEWTHPPLTGCLYTYCVLDAARANATIVSLSAIPQSGSLDDNKTLLQAVTRSLTALPRAR